MPYSPPKPGDPLPAGWLSALWAGVVARTRVIGGPGVRVSPGPGGEGVVVGLDGDRGTRFEAVITAAPPFAPTDPAACVYTARALGMDLTLAGVAPELGRPTRNNEWKLWPARVGERCQIVRLVENGDTRDVLKIETEAIAGKACP